MLARTGDVVWIDDVRSIDAHTFRHNGEAHASLWVDDWLAVKGTTMLAGDLASRLRTLADQLDAAAARLRVEQQHQPLFEDGWSMKVLDGVARFKESIR